MLKKHRHRKPGTCICCESAVLMMALLLVCSGFARADHDTENKAISDQMQSYLADKTKTAQPRLDETRLHEFYASRGFHPAWVNASGKTKHADQWRQVITTAREEGLNPETYHASLIEKQWHKETATGLAYLELLLTDAFFRYSEHVGAGKMAPEEADFFWDIDAPLIDPVAQLRNLLTVENFEAALSGLPPSHAGYQRLRAALARYRQQAEWGGWPSIEDGPVLRLGHLHDHVPALRQRLIVEGDLNLGPVQDERLFDQALKYAVERFQVRHGLRMDGVVGNDTRAVMNVPINERISNIKQNMDRWRWLPRNLGKRYILVNVAGFELAVVENNKPDFTMWVIVGKPGRPTPVIRGKVHSVVFNPYWTIPRTILLEDIIPRQKADPGYLKREGIRVLRNGEEQDPAKINWAKINKDYIPYIFRQDPGPKNPLGRIKFLFSNDFDVYMHDTPKRHDFSKEVRAFSSGCIRVEHPKKLASYLLGEENGWTREKVSNGIKSGENKKVPIAGRMPIYLLYFTAWVGEHDTVHFRPDVYKRDNFYRECDEVDQELP